MYALSNLMKLNDLKEKQVDFDRLSVQQLKRYFETYQQLVNKKEIMNSLPDKGERLEKRLEQIQQLIKQKSGQFENKNAVEAQKKSLEPRKEVEAALNNKQNTSPEIDSILNKIESLKVDNLVAEKNESKNESRQLKEEKNYFSSSKKKTSNTDEEEKLRKIKAKIMQNNKNRYKYQTSKEISIEECYNILIEHEKKIREIQMKQTAEKLLQGQSVNYDYNFIGRPNEENSKYRESRMSKIDDEDFFLNEDSSDGEETGDYFDQNDYDSKAENGGVSATAIDSAQIDKVYRSNIEKMKFRRAVNHDLESID